MKKSLLLIAGMFALTAAAQETTEPAFVAEALDGKTITLQCASGETATNGYFMIINGTTLSAAAAADHGTHPYKWDVEYDPEEQGMILSSGGYYIGRVPNSAKDANSKYFTLTQDKELAGRYRLYPNNDITSDDIQRYCLTATKFVNGTTIETISKFGGGTDDTANHWMQCDVSGNSAHITRWGSPANNSKWTYSVVEPDPRYLPVTTPRQIVDGGKYVIAVYNHHWIGKIGVDKRILTFEDNTSKFVTPTDATAESAAWTAHAVTYSCSHSTIHGEASTITLSHEDNEGQTQYFNPPTNETPTAPATAASDAAATSKLEFTVIEAPSGADAENTYFNIHFNNGTFFQKSLCIRKDGAFNRNSLVANDLKNLYDNNTDAYTTYYLVWRVIETESDLYSHANALLTMFGNRSFGPNLGQFNIAGDFTDIKTPVQNIISGMENSTEAVSIADIDAFVATGATKPTIHKENIHQNMPKTGTYLKFNGASTAGNSGATIHDNAFLYYTTTTSPSKTKLTVDKTTVGAGYTDAKTIMYLEAGDATGDHLLSYATGYYLGLDANDFALFNSEVDMTETGGNTPAVIGIAPGTATHPGSYQINYIAGTAHCGLHINGSGSAKWYADHCTNNGNLRTTTHSHDLHDWYVTLITELPVNIGADGKGSLIAPVAVTVPAGSDDFTFYTAATNSDGTVGFEVVTQGDIPANTPIVIKRSSNCSDQVCNVTINYNHVDAPATRAAETETDERFFGSYRATVAPAAGENEVIYVKSATATGSDDDDVVFSKVNAGDVIPAGTIAFKAVKDSNEEAPATFTLNLDANNSGTTSINNLYVESERVADDAIYDLQGRRLSAPARGINIINGKKILVK